MERRTILIVDDVRDVVATLALLLESEGYGVIKAYDGHRAWRLARTQLPDAVITDVSMPRMDGLELCRRLRRHPWTRHIPIIVSSALPVPVSEAGWHDLQLRKPACLDDILTGLSRLLARQTRGPSGEPVDVNGQELWLTAIVESSGDAIISQTTLIYRRMKNLRAVQLLLGHSTLESPVAT